MKRLLLLCTLILTSACEMNSFKAHTGSSGEVADGGATSTPVPDPTPTPTPDPVPVPAPRPFLNLVTFQAAQQVVGQADFTTNLSTTDDKSFASPYGSIVKAGGKVFFPDYSNHRVLGFNSMPVGNGAAANFVLGQLDFTSKLRDTTDSSLSGPQTLRTSGTQLFVTDYGNNRVLIYNTIPSAIGAAANLVVGWPDFSTPSRGCSQTTLDSPEDFIVVGTKLIVSDSNNNRVLIWNTIPTSNGVPADLVLGQADFTNCPANAGLSSPDATTMKYPAGVWSDGTKLMVADTNNNRVLIWSEFPTVNAEPADVVLGQGLMTTSSSGISDTSLNYPYFLTSNGTQLFVADASNNRVLVWNDIDVLANNSPADTVLGQGDFSSNTKNDDDQNDVDDGAASARTLNYPAGVFVDGTDLIITDTSNNRYLIFKGQ